MTVHAFGDRLPSLRDTNLETIGHGVAARLLTPRQRQTLLNMATRIALPARRTVYRAGTSATSAFICQDGALKSYRELPSGKRRVAAFLFKGDLFGLADNGCYVNTVETLTPVVYWRIPLEPLRALLKQDGELGFHFLCKVLHDLREMQFRGIIMGRRSAAGRVAMFLTTLERQLVSRGPHDAIPLPMSRSDIADYLGLSLEAVSRAGRQLVEDGLVAFSGPRAVRVLNRKGLEKLASDV